MLWLENGSALPAETALTVNGGEVDLGGTATAALTTVTLVGGSIVDGTLEADTELDLYGGTILADIGGTAALVKLGPHTVILGGLDTYSGGTSVLAGTLVAMNADSLPARRRARGTVIVQPTLYWSGSGDWTTGQWELADGSPAPWTDGCSVVIASGSDLNITGTVNVGAITMGSDVTITGGTLSLSAWGGTINVLSGTATIDSTFTAAAAWRKPVRARSCSTARWPTPARRWSTGVARST